MTVRDDACTCAIIGGYQINLTCLLRKILTEEKYLRARAQFSQIFLLALCPSDVRGLMYYVDLAALHIYMIVLVE